MSLTSRLFNLWARTPEKKDRETLATLAEHVANLIAETARLKYKLRQERERVQTLEHVLRTAPVFPDWAHDTAPWREWYEVTRALALNDIESTNPPQTEYE